MYNNSEILINREVYLNKLIEVKDIHLIKVVTGIRRCGKSSLLLLFHDYLLKNGIEEKNIIHINFESAEWDNLKTKGELYNYIKNKYDGKKIYIILDEIQFVEEWEKTINSIFVDFDCDIYITGSNAYLFSSELATILAGRNYTINMYPYSFKEYLNAYLKKKNYATLELNDWELDGNKKIIDEKTIPTVFDNYLKYGGMPQLIDFNENENATVNYLSNIRDSVILKDIIERNKIKDVPLLTNLIKYTASCIGNLVSPNKISEELSKNGSTVTNETIDNYLYMMTQAYLIYHVPRYELNGKMLLKTQGKYYFADTGLRNIVLGFHEYNSGSAYENVVYIELLRRGYTVYVGKYKEIEVDFVAIKPDETIYIQVCRSIMDEKVEEREIKPLLSIKDNNKKMILTMDIGSKNVDGIEIKNIIDFVR